MPEESPQRTLKQKNYQKNRKLYQLCELAPPPQEILSRLGRMGEISKILPLLRLEVQIMFVTLFQIEFDHV